MSCRHTDIRRFDEVRCCLACGEAVLESLSSAAATDQIAGTPYQYRRLNYTLGQEIRLIELLPGLPSEDIRCNIIHVNLDDDPKFEAVSYTWATEDGDDTFSKTIYTSSNTTMSVTANCMSALRQLRKMSNVRRLWVDAVCIDQTNPSERNHQVAMMTQIYTQAVNVRICIEDLRPRRLADGPMTRDYGPLFEWLQNPSESRPTLIFRDLRHLISLRYFERVWVIQEVALARAVYLHVNDKDVLFSRAILRYIQCKYPTGGVLSWDTSFKIKADLLTCLRAGMSGQCTDPKDKVFAVLGLMEPVARSLIPINYSLNIEELYAYVIIAIVKVYKKMDILRRTGWRLQIGVEYFQSMFRRYQNGTTYQIDMNDQFLDNLIGPWSYDLGIQTLPSSIPITLTEDSVAATATTNGSMINTLTGVPLPALQVRAHMIDIVVDKTNSSSYGAIGRPECITAYFELGPNETNNHSDDYYSKLYEFNDKRYFIKGSWGRVRQQTNLKDLLAFAKALDDKEHAKVFYTYYSIGFCRSEIRRGDMIFAVDGVRAPLILRRHDGSSSGYRVVGECYLWAALELDYWNPGTKKGIWSSRPYDLGQVQTGMIDIY